MHWGYDIGAANVTRGLVRRSGGWGVLARFSRLLCDPNRDPSDPTLVLRACDDGVPSFNRRVDVAERVARFHAPFHAAVDDALRANPPAFLVSVHSFTPVFRGHARGMEAGVLFDRHDALAERWVRALNDVGVRTEANAPYSGKEGLIYSPSRHGTAQGVAYLELELRQDLIRTARQARHVSGLVWRSLLGASLV
jgi:predicted N-formylglutamate amidohydrolase